MQSEPITIAPMDAYSVRNIEAAIQTLDGLIQSAETLLHAAQWEENKDFAHVLVSRAETVCEVARQLNAGSVI